MVANVQPPAGSQARPPLRPPQPGGSRGRLVAALLHDLLASQPPGVTVLDCGGGTGAFAVPLAAAGARVTVVDRSIDALALLGRRAAEAGVSDRIAAVPGDLDAEDLGLRDPGPSEGGPAQFDIVVAHNVLAAVVDPGRTLASIVARVARDGWLSLQVANPAAAVLGRAMVGDTHGAMHALRTPAAGSFGVAELRAVCRQLGLTIEQLHGVGVLTEYVAGADPEVHGSTPADLVHLEDALASRRPYLDIASRLHVLARRGRRPAVGSDEEPVRGP